MLINRRTFLVKPGLFDKAAYILIHATEETAHSSEAQLYRSKVGDFDTLEVEIAFENLAEYEHFWSGVFANPEATAVMNPFENRL